MTVGVLYESSVISTGQSVNYISYFIDLFSTINMKKINNYTDNLPIRDLILSIEEREVFYNLYYNFVDSLERCRDNPENQQLVIQKNIANREFNKFIESKQEEVKDLGIEEASVQKSIFERLVDLRIVVGSMFISKNLQDFYKKVRDLSE